MLVVLFVLNDTCHKWIVVLWNPEKVRKNAPTITVSNRNRLLPKANQSVDSHVQTEFLATAKQAQGSNTQNSKIPPLYMSPSYLTQSPIAGTKFKAHSQSRRTPQQHV